MPRVGPTHLGTRRCTRTSFTRPRDACYNEEGWSGRPRSRPVGRPGTNGVRLPVTSTTGFLSE